MHQHSLLLTATRLAGALSQPMKRPLKAYFFKSTMRPEFTKIRSHLGSFRTAVTAAMTTPEDTRQCAAERGEAKGEVKGDTFPVVQGTPIGVPVGAPQIPMGVVVAVSSLTVEVGVPVGAPQMPMVAVSPLKGKEQEVLNYRAAVLVLSGLDIAATLLKTAALLASTRNLVWLALALFILGPLSGMVGAKTLNHNLVSVYFAFCGLKIAAEIAFAINVWEWNVLFVVMQVWIIKIVAAFLSALERISPERRSELLDLKDVAVHRVYW